MEFLKEVLGDELYEQVSEKINAYNGDDANKDSQIKIGNLGSGNYISKLKYDDITAQLTGKQTELDTANNLIAELKKGTKGDEGLQEKITGYESQVASLQEELKETKLKSAIKVALLSEKAVDVDYLTFKLNEKLKEDGETLELDENDNIKGWKDRVSELKTQFPTMFESTTAKEDKKIEENPLKKGDPDDEGMSKSDILKKSYAERAKLYEENPEAYKEAMKK